MKKRLIYNLLITTLFGILSAGCRRENTDNPQPEGIKLLVSGLWEVTETYTVEPTDKITLKLKKGALGFKFYTDGSAESCSFGTCKSVGRWSFQRQDASTNSFTMYFEAADQKQVFGDLLSGPLAIIDDNHISWLIEGKPTIGNTDATYMRWTMERNQ